MADGPTESVQPAQSAAAVAQPAAKPPQPTEFPPAVKSTIEWLNRAFGHWYEVNPPPLPDRFTRREFGYILWPERPGTPPFLRHRGYDSAERFHGYLSYAGPHSVYYSTAYYRRPAEMKMVDKEWLGAELIFDLDADHLAEAEKAKAEGKEMPLAEQLALVKEQFKRLLDEFLFGDFGLSEDNVWITFSGGRGYHAHVVEPRLMQLDSKARREIVDYITGKFPAAKGTDQPSIEHLFRRVAVPGTGKSFGRHGKADYNVLFPTPDSGGWGGRLARVVVEDLRRHVVEADDKAAKAWLMEFPDVGAKRAADFITFIRNENKLDRFAGGSLDRDGNVHGKGVLTGSAGAGNVVQKVFERAAGQMALPLAKGETDEPVTADVKRLIRLPGSLHGKSGLKVVTMTRSELDAFEPLRDAVAFTMDPVKIIPRFDQEMTLGGERVAVKKGEATEVPEAHAVFWCARQGGTRVEK